MSPVFDCRDEAQLLAGMRQARQAIGRGELVVLPTDTVYGIAADAFSARAVQGLLEAKGRGRQSPPPVLVAGVATLRALVAEVPEAVERLVEAFWPGGLTIVLPSQPSLSWDLGDTHGTVAVRMPANNLALELLEETGPLAVSSANLTGKAAAIMASDAQGMLGDSVAVYLDGGPSATGIASTIVDATSLVTGVAPLVRVLREGAVDRAAAARGARRPARARPGADADATGVRRARDHRDRMPSPSCSGGAPARGRASAGRGSGRPEPRAEAGVEAGPRRRRVKQYVFTILFTAAVTLGTVVGGLATEPEVQAVSRHPRARRPQDADSAARRGGDVPRRGRRVRRVVAASVLRDLLGRPRAGLRDPRRDAPHRRRRSRRRPVGPRLDDQARRAVPRRRASSPGSGSCRSSRCRSAG